MARELSEKHGDEGPRVVVYGWSELCEKLQKHPHLYDTWHRMLLGSAPPPPGGWNRRWKIVLVALAATVIEVNNWEMFSRVKGCNELARRADQMLKNAISVCSG